MPLTDTHAHIYLPEFESDLQQVMERAVVHGITRILLPAIDSSTHNAMLQAEEKFSICTAMMGLHPCSVNQDAETELEIVREWVRKRKFVAIGEIGLDFYWDKTFVQQQYEAFHWQIQLAREYELPIAIHSRNAIDECIEVVQQYPDLKGVFHCFSGNYQQAVKIADTGFFMGIGGVLTFKNSGLDKVIEKLGCTQLILETDAPYLAPVPYRGKRNEPSYTSIVAEKLAAVTKKTKEEIAELTTENARKLFNL